MSTRGRCSRRRAHDVRQADRGRRRRERRCTPGAGCQARERSSSVERTYAATRRAFRFGARSARAQGEDRARRRVPGARAPGGDGTHAAPVGLTRGSSAAIARSTTLMATLQRRSRARCAPVFVRSRRHREDPAGAASSCDGAGSLEPEPDRLPRALPRGRPWDHLLGARRDPAIGVRHRSRRSLGGGRRQAARRGARSPDAPRRDG